MAYEIWATDCAGKAAYPSLCRYEKLQAQKRQRVRITVEMTKALWYNQKTENMNGAIIMDDLTYTTSMIQEIKELLSGARQRVAVQVNNELLSTYWNIGRIIVEHEQESRERAAYGK